MLRPKRNDKPLLLIFPNILLNRSIARSEKESHPLLVRKDRFTGQD